MQRCHFCSSLRVEYTFDMLLSKSNNVNVIFSFSFCKDCWKKYDLHNACLEKAGINMFANWIKSRST